MDDGRIFMAADQAWKSRESCARSFFAVWLDSGVLDEWGNKLFDRIGRFLPVPFDESLQHFYFRPMHVFHRLSNGSVDETVATGSAMGRGDWAVGSGFAGPTSEINYAS